MEINWRVFKCCSFCDRQTFEIMVIRSWWKMKQVTIKHPPEDSQPLKIFMNYTFCLKYFRLIKIYSILFYSIPFYSTIHYFSCCFYCENGWQEATSRMDLWSSLRMFSMANFSTIKRRFSIVSNDFLTSVSLALLKSVTCFC